MKRILSTALLLGTLAAPAFAALKPGDAAPAEAHDFAEATAQFKAAGATLIGMSADDIGTLHKFSTQECSSKFPVAADPDLKVIKAFDSVMEGRNISDRISYVIGQDGKVVYAFHDRNPDKHVQNTLGAVKALTKK